MTDNNSHQLVQKLWNYSTACATTGCRTAIILRQAQPACVDTQTGLPQLTFLLFPKMADEQSRAPFSKLSPIPKNIDWQGLMMPDGDELETHYRHVLESLGKQKGVLGSPLVNLEKPPEGSKIGVGMRWNHGEG